MIKKEKRRLKKRSKRNRHTGVINLAKAKIIESSPRRQFSDGSTYAYILGQTAVRLY